MTDKKGSKESKKEKKDEIPSFDPKNPLKIINWMYKNDDTWIMLNTKSSQRAYLKEVKEVYNLNTNQIEIIIGLIPSKKKNRRRIHEDAERYEREQRERLLKNLGLEEE